jgi:hypothetical protein
MRFSITTTLPILDSGIGFTAAEMTAIGAVVVQGIRERTAEGRNTFDQPALPLKPKYQRLKVRKGKKPFRDLRFSGNMMAALDVLRADTDHCTVGVGDPFGQRAAFNQARDPWLGIAPSGEPALQRAVDAATDLLARRIFRRAA